MVTFLIEGGTKRDRRSLEGPNMISPRGYRHYYHSWLEHDFVCKIDPFPESFCNCIDKTNEEKDPDVETHEQKKLSECDEIVNYPVYRTSLRDFEV